MISARFHQLDPSWSDCLALLTLLPWPLLIILGKETDTSFPVLRFRDWIERHRIPWGRAAVMAAHLEQGFVNT